MKSQPAVTLPLPPAWPWYSEETADRVRRRVLAGDVFAFGRDPAVHRLEQWAREYFGVSHALAVSSGTAALWTAFHSLGLGPGDEVLVPTYTFHATATPLFLLGASPVLYDCDPLTARADVRDLESRITASTKAIGVTHMFGLPADMEAVSRIARARGIPVVEDAAQAHGATVGGRKTGTLGTVGCLSLGGQKMISGGMGGLLITDDSDVYQRALTMGHAHERALEELPPDSRWRAPAETGFGGNLRMHPLSAELALEHCASLDERIRVRTSVLEGLSDRLSRFPFLVPPQTPAGCTRGGWYGYKVVYRPELLSGMPVPEFVDLLKRQALRVARPSTRPLHQTWPFQNRDLGLPGYDPHGSRPVYIDADLPQATELYSHTIGFPDKHLHVPADDLLDQYAEGIARVADYALYRRERKD
ncbi:aminotransferase class I/II-fold pyridoxal phosphate-dependent enzyme [Streptosporangium subroseum]|uniref:aminotransferase class I/II-fold pyridoxal phosphate-dependent enzyme n=1 Tax=Streptosporangium subroseum TaxID=106412 RepID=UPI0030900E16|nr:aminotransferase class I/II-fold pyridoxal phosphate-dependent enzyme [Streptosporangium subroseum]